MIRVDHAGEYGAARIYAGQLAVLRGARRPRCCARCRTGTPAPGSVRRSDRAAAACVRPRCCRCGIWPASRSARRPPALGERAAMACTVAVEEAIDAHYADQIAALDDSEDELRNTLEPLSRRGDAASRHRAAAWRGRRPAIGCYRQRSRPGCKVAIRSASAYRECNRNRVLGIRGINLEVLRKRKGPPTSRCGTARQQTSRRRHSSIRSQRTAKSSRALASGYLVTQLGRPTSTPSMIWCISISTRSNSAARKGDIVWGFRLAAGSPPRSGLRAVTGCRD